MRRIFDSSDAFEAWMRQRTDVSRRLLKKKHELMREGPFPFLRATFYRWVEQWPKVCPELAARGEDVLLTVAICTWGPSASGPIRNGDTSGE